MRTAVAPLVSRAAPRYGLPATSSTFPITLPTSRHLRLTHLSPVTTADTPGTTDTHTLAPQHLSIAARDS